MMKWGRKKKKVPSSSSTASNSSSSSSISRPHLISHVLPVSWLTQSKQSSSEKPGKLSKSTTQMRDQSHFQEQSSRFYTQDDDGFWRLSFGDQGENNVMKEVKTAATTKKSSTQKPNCEKQQLGRVQETGEETGEVERSASLRRTYRRIIEATSELQRELDEVKDGYRKSVEKEMPELELFQAMQMMGRSNNVGRMHEKEDDKREWERIKEEKIKEVLSKKNEKQRKSVHIGGNCNGNGNGNGYGNNNNKVRTVRSPRTSSYSKGETCKIRAIERLRREKTKKKMKEMAVLDEQAAALGSFAVVKCSCEPDEDFRESMIEMIVAKRIRRPEQLEELLACYLTLNADEYHDLIIKVFRQVWCELRQQGYYNYRGL